MFSTVKYLTQYAKMAFSVYSGAKGGQGRYLMIFNSVYAEAQTITRSSFCLEDHKGPS